jgi:hypothetical protein
MENSKYYKGIAEQMIDEDRERDLAYINYEAMDRCEWDLPPQVNALTWIRKVVSTDPHDALSAGARVLSSLDDRLTIMPLSTNLENKQMANDWERNLRWQMMSANRRRQGKVQRDVARSALTYDEVIAQVVDLDYQIEGMKMFGGNTKRMEIARRYGRFIINTFNPRHVHVRYSSAMPEAVLLCQKRKARSVMADWGDLAKKLKRVAEEDGMVEYYDYMDYDVRYVWVEGGSEECEIVKPSEHGIPFLPWVAVIGGNTLEDDGKHKRQPLLYSVYQSGQWDTQNVVKSLYTSEVIAHASAPRAKEEGANPDSTEFDYGDPGRHAKVPPGNTYTPLDPPGIDQALLEIDERHAAAIDKSTVSRILVSGDVPSGTAYSTLNLATQTALGALKPAKELAEKALAEIYTQMLLWVEHSGKDLVAWGSAKDDKGMQYIVRSEDIDPSGLYLSVTLTPDAPTDRMQKINAAIMAKQLGMSNETALEELGVTDPLSEIQQSYIEQLQQAMMANVIQSMQMELQNAQQMQMQAQQMQMQSQAMQEQEAQAMVNQGMAPGMPGVEGQGFNPAMGGMPPALMNPAATREEQTGYDITGTPAIQMGGL